MASTQVNPSAQNVTQYNVQTGAANNNLNNVAPSSTSGVPVISQGSAAQPIFGTAVVAGGGTGVTSFANTSALLASGTTTTGNLQNIASVATGQVLISAGTSTIPTWSAAPSVTSVTLGGGTALGNYLEGTFTPGIAFGGGTTGITYSTQTGQYTRIGDIVFFVILISLSNKGSSTGNATVTGLPVAASLASQRGFMPVANNFTFTTNYTLVEWDTIVGSTFSILQYGAGVAVTNATNTNFANNTILQFEGFYFV